VTNSFSAAWLGLSTKGRAPPARGAPREIVSESRVGAGAVPSGKVKVMPASFQEAGEEGEVALAVLDRELELGVARAVDLPLVVDGHSARSLSTMSGIDRCWKMRWLRRWVRSHSAGTMRERVGGELDARAARRDGLDLLDRSHDAGPAAVRDVRPFERDGDAEGGRLADDRLEIDAGVLRPHHERDLEELRDGLGDLEPADAERLARSHRKEQGLHGHRPKEYKFVRC
jgi:hypothetical protein